MPQLKVKAGPGKGKVFPIESDSVKLGRDSSCEIKLKDNGVSREHAEIYRVGEMHFIRDLGSRNGIIVNDLPIEDELLRDGDIIRIGNFNLVFTGSLSSMGNDESDIASDSFYESDKDPASTLTLKIGPDQSRKSKNSPKLETALCKLIPIFKLHQSDSLLIKETLNILFEIIDIQECYVFIIEANNKLAQKGYKATKGNKKGKASKSIVLRTLKEGRPIFTANAQDDFRFKTETSIIMKNVSSVLCCPLASDGKEIGVIYMNNGPLKQPFNEESAEIVEIISTCLALALSQKESARKEKVIQTNSVKLLANITESHAKILEGRGERVAKICQKIGEYMHLKPFQMDNLFQAAYLHHMGYMENKKDHTYSLDILQNDLDYVDQTLDLLRKHGGFNNIYSIIKYHRYKKDGSGSPPQTPEDDWTVESQILALAVELELRINLPLSFQASDKPLASIVEGLKGDLTKMVDASISSAFLDAFKDGAILNE